MSKVYCHSNYNSFISCKTDEMLDKIYSLVRKNSRFLRTNGLLNSIYKQIKFIESNNCGFSKYSKQSIENLAQLLLNRIVQLIIIRNKII